LPETKKLNNPQRGCETTLKLLDPSGTPADFRIGENCLSQKQKKPGAKLRALI
jgi:hypothetical protein